MTFSIATLRAFAVLFLIGAPTALREEFGSVYCTTNPRQACVRLSVEAAAVAAGTRVTVRVANLEGSELPDVTPVTWARFEEIQLLARVGGPLTGADPVGALVITRLSAIEEYGDGPVKWALTALDADPDYVAYSLYTDTELWGADLIGCTVPPNESAPFYRTCGAGGADPGSLQFTFILPGQFQASDLGLMISLEDDEGFTGCGINGAHWTHSDVPLCVPPGPQTPPPPPPTYALQGFFAPVDNPPALNLLKAGSAVPVKFSLGGDFGLNVLAAGFPQSQAVSCTASSSIEAIEETVTAGSSSLSYDLPTGQYTYVWKTEKAWTGNCRRLTLKLSDGQFKEADFKFSK
jgi:hypothetical protein